MTWLAGFEQILAPSGGGYFANDVPDKLVLHTTEGGTIEGAVSAYRASNSWPHFTVDPRTRRKVQHISLSRSAMALYNDSSTSVETNRAGDVIQVEIVARAAETHLYDDDWYSWLATEVVRPICQEQGLPPRCTRFYGAGDGWILASENWVGRMGAAEWNAYNGICGHQNVGDGNDHWDPGRLDQDRLMLFAFGGGEIYDTVTKTSRQVGVLDLAFTTEDEDLKPDERNMLIQVHGVLGNPMPGWNRPPSINDLFAFLNDKLAAYETQMAAIRVELAELKRTGVAPTQPASASEVAAELLALVVERAAKG